jgi:sugar/nucleoside kinase (ribokinase family)
MSSSGPTSRDRTILVSGLINLEVTLRVDGFPVHYTPVRYPFGGVNSAVSGVGFNIAKALTVLDDNVTLISMIGDDEAGRLVRDVLASEGIPGDFVIDPLAATPHSVILFDPSGRRQINVDLKDIQEQAYPHDRFASALGGCDLAVLCNINFSRPFLRLANDRGIPVATDVHAVADLDDGYNRDFMQAADILFMSDELLPVAPEEWAGYVLDRYSPQILVIGLGADGALLAVRAAGYLERLPAVYTRPVANTIGAGDALFSAFVHVYARSGDPYVALAQAMTFASYKIGATGAADGFLTAAELDDLHARVAGAGHV